MAKPGSIEADALDELEEVYAMLRAKSSSTMAELGMLGRIAGILRRAKRIK